MTPGVHMHIIYKTERARRAQPDGRRELRRANKRICSSQSDAAYGRYKWYICIRSLGVPVDALRDDSGEANKLALLSNMSVTLSL